MAKRGIIIAIDPDVDYNGVAELDTETKAIKGEKVSFPELISKLQYISSLETKVNYTIAVEAGWLNQSIWHNAYHKGAKIASKIGNSTGRNHEVGRKIIEMSKFYGLKTIEQRPLRKCWKGTDGKITQEELMQFIPNCPKRISQDVRDAILIAWNVAEFPIRIRV